MPVLSIIALGAFLVAHIYVYILMDGWMQRRSDAVVTGVIGGVALPMRHRWMILHVRWVPLVVGIISWQTVLGMLWMLIGERAADQNVGLVAYLFAFIVFASAFGWLTLAPFWYLDLRATLRQAEAD
jgi:hypothetical protein